MMSMQSLDHVVYCLECAGGRFYVGRCLTHMLAGRFQAHAAGQGAAFTRLHRPLRIAFTRTSLDPLDEDHVVLMCMREHGIANVRGGSFSSVELGPDVTRVLEMQLVHAAGRCFKCGQTGHFSSDCLPARQQRTSPSTCKRCGRTNHTHDKCFAHRDAQGRKLHSKCEMCCVGVPMAPDTTICPTCAAVLVIN